MPEIPAQGSWASGFGRGAARAVCLLVLCIVAGFGARPAAAQATASLTNLAAIYERAAREFSSAFYLKPSEKQRGDPLFRFAPLILQVIERGAARPPSLGAGPGRVSLAGGEVKFDRKRPALYAEVDSTLVNGAQHPRFTYLWCYSAGSRANMPSRALALQGVRVTLNSAGAPVIWEALADSSPADLLFVSETLELDAEAQFGKALPGRRYAVERGTNQAPEAVVARVIADGPTPMGPILYLAPRTHAVATLICRCMPAQVKKLAGSGTYELLPLDQETRLLFERIKAETGEHTAFWPGEPEREPRLRKCLRLPSSF